MPVYCSCDGVKGGVPLGGIGAGKLEVGPSGVFSAFTFQNNWSKPISGADGYPGVLGFHLGISVKFERGGKRLKRSYLLQSAPVRGLPVLKPVRYEGLFPKMGVYYRVPGVNAEVCLEAFSPWVPGDVRHSSLPVVFFKWRVKNPSHIPLDVGLLFMARNTSGEWCVGRQNRIREEPGSIRLELLNRDPSSRDVRRGSLMFSFLKGPWTLSFMEGWNAVTKNFSFTSMDLSVRAWEAWVKDGRLPNHRTPLPVAGENHELCGAVAAAQRLPAGKETEWLFEACWYFPHHGAYGHRYSKFFGNVQQVSAYASRKRKALEAKVSKLHALVFSLPFPSWFNDALLANLAPFFASSWYTRDGRFAFYEAPEVCPLMGTLDVGFYGSIPLSYFFPELEYSLISQFARAQRADGYIPHDLGRERLDLPSNGTTFYLWKDLNPKFILMVYRDFLWSGRRKWLKALYPHVRKALDWTLRADGDGDGLPDHEGADQTFDLWEFRGAHPYTSGIFLAALLASQHMAAILGDRPFSGLCRDASARARRSFEGRLWNGDYFGDTCTLAQLNGQWYADLLGLGSIASPEKIKKALSHVLKSNARHSRYGFVNSVLRNGRLDTSNRHAQNIWIGMNWAFIGLCLSRGFAAGHLLKEGYKVWDNISNLQKSPWNQPDMVDAKTGRYLFGDFYYRNMAIWSIPIMRALKDGKTSAILRRIRSLGTPKP